MVSRESAVHAVVVALAVAALLLLSLRFPDVDGRLYAVVAFVGFNGVVLAGAHLVLALRGEDGLVPVASRWRFVAVVAVVLSLGAIAILFEPVSLGPVSSHNVLGAMGLAAAVAYLLIEARDGYRESTAD